MWWLTGIRGIAKALEKWQGKLADAKTEQERIRAQAMVDLNTNRLNAQTRGDMTWLPKGMRALSYTPFVLFLWKVIVWDKLLGWGVTDDLSPHLWQTFYVMLGFYFLTDVTRVFTSRK